MHRVRIASVLLLFLLLPLAASVPAGNRELTQKIDDVMSAVYKPGEPGAAILVQRDGRTLLRKAYGLANLELGVAMEPDMVFRLGSITKQFTAVAVLMLAEQGKLSLQDDVTKYLPYFQSQGRQVTIEHLLTHTSGIKSYTNLDEWLPLWRKDMTPQEIVELSKGKPFEFEPGQRWNYDNTGYVMLGAVIEKVTGQTYEQFVTEHIFAPLGMKHSCYDHTERVIPRRVAGYQKGDEGFVNAPYLSMTQPYAAGSLLSSVDDMAIWNEAVFAGKLVKKEWLDKAFTPYRLADGESTGYGYGWFVSSLEGHCTIEHGGGINGFTSYGLALPEDHVYVAILTNSAIGERAPEPRAVKIAGLVLGLNPAESKAVPLTAEQLDALVGVYENENHELRTISREGDQLFSRRGNGEKYPLHADSPLEFSFVGTPTRLTFTRNAAGQVDGARLKARLGPAEPYHRSTQPPPTARREIALDAAKLGRYPGTFELMPGFSIVVTLEGGHLMGQATGQPKFELFAESETSFFLKVVDAQVEFDLDAAGQVTGLTLLQGGQKLPGKKVR